MRIVFDEIKRERPGFWVIEVDGREVVLSQNICSIDELEHIAEVPIPVLVVALLTLGHSDTGLP